MSIYGYEGGVGRSRGSIANRKWRQRRGRIMRILTSTLLVAPGDDLGDSGEYEAGHGVLAINGRSRALKQGRMNNRGGTVR